MKTYFIASICKLWNEVDANVCTKVSKQNRLKFFMLMSGTIVVVSMMM